MFALPAAAVSFSPLDEVKNRTGPSPRTQSFFTTKLFNRRRAVRKALHVTGVSTQEYERRKALSVLGLTEDDVKVGERFYFRRAAANSDAAPGSPMSPLSRKRSTSPLSYRVRSRTASAVMADPDAAPAPVVNRQLRAGTAVVAFDDPRQSKAFRVLGMDATQFKRLKAVHILGVPDFEVDQADHQALAALGK